MCMFDGSMDPWRGRDESWGSLTSCRYLLTIVVSLLGYFTFIVGKQSWQNDIFHRSWVYLVFQVLHSRICKENHAKYKGEILKGTRTEIVNAIALQMWCHTQYPTSGKYTGALRMLVDKYPVLKDKFGNGIVSIVIHSEAYVYRINYIMHNCSSWVIALYLLNHDTKLATVTNLCNEHLRCVCTLIPLEM